jgi:deoxyadenosine/deoxycytidine kinase
MFAEFTVSDYAFIKTLLFARQNLEEGEFKMFNQIFTTLNQSFPQPEILVYFHRSVENLQANISKRGREYEIGITDAYLTKVQNSYFEYFRNILSFPVLIIDLNTIDFETNDRNYEEVKMLLAKKYNPGVHRISLMV